MSLFPRLVINFLVLIMSFCACNSSAKTIQVAVFKDHFETINIFTKNQECPRNIPDQFQDNQMVAEYLILCNALEASGQQFNIKLIPFPVAERALQAIERHEIDVTGFGIWHQQIADFDAKASIRLLNNNEFTKGLYTSKQKLQEINSFHSKDSNKLVISLNKNWQHDWQELSCSGLKLKHIDQYEQMFQLVALGRIDLVPLTFNNKQDMRRTAFGIPLYPIEGVKFTINDSLHFAIDDKTATGKQVSEALDIGLTVLSQQAYISSVYENLGITNAKTQHWDDVGCQQMRVAQK